MTVLLVFWVKKDKKGTEFSDEHTALVFSYPRLGSQLPEHLPSSSEENCVDS